MLKFAENEKEWVMTVQKFDKGNVFTKAGPQKGVSEWNWQLKGKKKQQNPAINLREKNHLIINRDNARLREKDFFISYFWKLPLLFRGVDNALRENWDKKNVNFLLDLSRLIAWRLNFSYFSWTCCLRLRPMGFASAEAEDAGDNRFVLHSFIFPLW